MPPPRSFMGPMPQLLVDAHVHFQEPFDLERFLDFAYANFRAEATRAGHPHDFQGCLLLAEAAGQRLFARLEAHVADGAPASTWSFCRCGEAGALLAHSGERRLVLLAGRQVASAEGLELLALATPESFEEGAPLSELLERARTADAIPVLPWGFGKWSGRRGALIRRLVDEHGGRELYLGDNGGRARLATEPALFERARGRGLRILPGSDPLPFRSQIDRAGRFGFRMEAALSQQQPVSDLKAALRDPSLPLTPYGRLETTGRFLANQARAQLRKRLALPARTSAESSGRTLVVVPQPFFSPRGTPFSVYYRSLVLGELGVEQDLLTYGQGADVDVPGLRIVRIPDLPFLGEIRIGPSWPKLVLDGLMLLWTLGLLLRHRYRVVHAHEEAVFFCRVLKPLFGFKLVYDMHSCLPQQLENFEFTKSRGLIGLFRWLEDSALRAADAVITICPDLADYVERLGIESERHFLIENSLSEPVRLLGESGAAPDDAPSPESAVPDDLELVVYAGTLEPYQGIDLLLESFAKLVQRRPAFLLVAGGSGEQVSRYRRQAEALGLAERVRFTGRVPQRLAQHWCSLATLQVSPRISGTNTPLKIYEQLSNGIPLVATSIYSHSQVLNEDVAFLAEPEPAAFANALERALREEELRQEKVAAARRLYEERYSRRHYENQLSRLLARIA